MEKIKVSEVLIVEGKYDVNTLKQVFDATILSTGGFGIFNDSDTLALIRRLAEARGVVILTDSDSAGFLIRNHLKGSIDPRMVKHAYIPDISGKEKRKPARSKEGKLGVEGMRPDVLIDALRRAGATLNGESVPASGGITKTDLYVLGLTGRPNSAKLRQRLLMQMQLPEHLTANALLEVLNILTTREELAYIVQSL